MGPNMGPTWAPRGPPKRPKTAFHFDGGSPFFGFDVGRPWETDLGAIWRPSWGPLGPILGVSGANLGPSWAILGPSGAILAHLDPILGAPSPSKADLDAYLGFENGDFARGIYQNMKIMMSTSFYYDILFSRDHLDPVLPIFGHLGVISSSFDALNV